MGYTSMKVPTVCFCVTTNGSTRIAACRLWRFRNGSVLTGFELSLVIISPKRSSIDK